MVGGTVTWKEIGKLGTHERGVVVVSGNHQNPGVDAIQKSAEKLILLGGSVVDEVAGDYRKVRRNCSSVDGIDDVVEPRTRIDGKVAEVTCDMRVR